MNNLRPKEVRADVERDEGRQWFRLQSTENDDAWIRTDNAAHLGGMV